MISIHQSIGIIREILAHDTILPCDSILLAYNNEWLASEKNRHDKMITSLQYMSRIQPRMTIKMEI